MTLTTKMIDKFKDYIIPKIELYNQLVLNIESIEKVEEMLNDVTKDIKNAIPLLYSDLLANELQNIYYSNIPNFSTFGIKAEQVLHWIHVGELYWIGNYFDTTINERMKKAAAAIYMQGLSREQAGALMRDVFGVYLIPSRNNLGIRGYFEGVANNIITRTTEFARIERYENAGVEFYQISAVLDKRTSQICNCMNGKIFAVKDGRRLINEMIATPVEELKDKFGWLTPTKTNIKKLQTTEKLNWKLALPPYHFNCRTRTVAVDGN